MNSLVALNSQTHRDLRIDAARALREHANVNVVSVIPREFPRLLAQYPIFFAKSSESGQFEPAALLGFERGENLFLTEGRWDAVYVPLQIQHQPFTLLPRSAAPGAQSTLDLAFDPNSPYLQSNDGERLFQDDGQPSKFLENISSMLAAMVSGSREAYAFTGRLAELNLLEPVRVDIEFVDASDTKLQGLYWIAAAALKALPAAQLAELRDREYLEWMYFQMASLAHMSALVARKNKRLSGLTPAPRGEAGNADPR
ncbi:MAG TPA: SapC family protein [Steroidobacteraceae bacterium]